MLTLDFTPGVEPPETRLGREVQVWRDDGGQAIARAFAGQKYCWIEWASLGVFAFTPGARNVLAWPVAGADPQVIRVQFDRFLQPLILQALGWQTLHAGAVCGSSGVLAFCGRRGAGKSTVTYALRRLGWMQIADDTLVIRMFQDRITVSPLPFISRFREASYELFAKDIGEPPATSVVPDSGAPPLRAAIVLRQDTRRGWPQAVRLPEAEAFSELLSHACTFNNSDRDEVRRLTEDYLTLAQRTPVFAVTYRPDLGRLPELLGAIESVAASLGVQPTATPSAVTA